MSETAIGSKQIKLCPMGKLTICLPGCALYIKELDQCSFVQISSALTVLAHKELIEIEARLRDRN